MEGKGTGKCYPHQVQNYRAWFKQEQSWIATSNPSRVALPAFPVTAAKVAAFLHHESTCEKVCTVCSCSSSTHQPKLPRSAQVWKQVRDNRGLVAGQVSHCPGRQCIGEPLAQP